MSCDVVFGKVLEGATTKVFLSLHICGILHPIMNSRTCKLWHYGYNEFPSFDASNYFPNCKQVECVNMMNASDDSMKLAIIGEF